MSEGRPAPGPTPRRRVNPALLVIAVVAVLVAIVVVVVTIRRDDEPGASRQGVVTIKAADGVSLTARVTRPPGSGRHPLVVMPASYNAAYTEYAAVGRSLTATGFVTVSYTQRGFFTSGGTVDLAGAKTRQDARTVIDWALRNTTADPARIGMLGVSYGAGVSLLTAATDERVRAVVALSTWTDLARAFRPDDTVNVLGLGGLLTVPRADPALTRLAQQLRSDPIGNGPRFDAFARPRSPVSYLAALNRNRPAIMLANGWQDSLFSPSMLVPFYERLTTPKRLQLSIGDHTGPELPLLNGGRSRTGDAALAWLQHHLAGRANGIDRQPPVQLEDVTTKAVQTYPSWPTLSPLRVSLAAPSTTRSAITGQPSTWSASLPVGQDSGAAIGGSQFVTSDKYIVPTVSVGALPRDHALVWGGDTLTQPARVVGTMTLSVSVASTAPAVAIFVYAYDVGPDGTGRLMAMSPYTVTDANRGPKAVSVALEPIDWTLPTGHRLSVVIDTVEPWWIQTAPAGSSVTVSSTAARPAGLAVPLA